MGINSYNKEWRKVYCPICGEELGYKERGQLASFECQTEGCSKTRHYFYPGQVKRPGKSVPWHSYHEKKSKCGCAACAARDSEDLEDYTTPPSESTFEY